MKQPDIAIALDIYYSHTEIGIKEIRKLFSAGESKALQLKKQATKEMVKRGVKAFYPHSVNVKIAFEVWGIDINECEKRVRKLNALRSEGVIV